MISCKTLQNTTSSCSERISLLSGWYSLREYLTQSMPKAHIWFLTFKISPLRVSKSLLRMSMVDNFLHFQSSRGRDRTWFLPMSNLSREVNQVLSHLSAFSRLLLMFSWTRGTWYMEEGSSDMRLFWRLMIWRFGIIDISPSGRLLIRELLTSNTIILPINLGGSLTIWLSIDTEVNLSMKLVLCGIKPLTLGLWWFSALLLCSSISVTNLDFSWTQKNLSFFIRKVWPFCS